MKKDTGQRGPQDENDRSFAERCRIEHERFPTDRLPERERDYFSFPQLAEIGSTAGADRKRDDERKSGVMADLEAYFRNCMFSVNGQSVVRARANVGNYPDPTLTWDEVEYLKSQFGACVLDDLEVPRAFALRFLQDHRILLPPGWFPESDESVPANLNQVIKQTQRSEARRTGAPGRPSSMDIIRAELGRRALRKEASQTAKAMSESLAAWLVQNHPNEPAPTPKAIQNALRTEIRNILVPVPSSERNPK